MFLSSLSTQAWGVEESEDISTGPLCPASSSPSFAGWKGRLSLLPQGRAFPVIPWVLCSIKCGTSGSYFVDDRLRDLKNLFLWVNPGFPDCWLAGDSSILFWGQKLNADFFPFLHLLISDMLPLHCPVFFRALTTIWNYLLSVSSH